MQIFKGFFKIVTSLRGMFITYTIIFLALAVAMANSGNTTQENSFKEEKCKVAVFDYDKSEESAAFTKYLGTKMKQVTCEDDKEKLLDKLFVRNIVAVIYIKDGYGSALENGETEKLLEITTLPGTTYSQTVSNHIDRYMSTVNAYLSAGMSVDEALDKTAGLMEQKAEVVMNGDDETQQHSKSYYFMMYLPYVFVACFVQAIGLVIFRFRKKEIRNRMDVSAYPFRKRNLALWSSILICGFGFALLFTVVAGFICGGELFTGRGALMVANLAFSVLWTLGLTYLVSAAVKKENALSMAGTVLALAVAFLGGMFVPLGFMGDGIKMVSHFVPSYWYVTALDLIDAGKAGTNAAELLGRFGMQAAFMAAFFGIGMGLSAKNRKAR